MINNQNKYNREFYTKQKRVSKSLKKESERSLMLNLRREALLFSCYFQQLNNEVLLRGSLAQSLLFIVYLFDMVQWTVSLESMT